jgi:hypothetical protein
VAHHNPHASETEEWERYEDYKCAAGRKREIKEATSDDMASTVYNVVRWGGGGGARYVIF